MILIVEDDIHVAEGLERMLRYSGHQAVAVSTCMEALSLLPVRQPNLIILDLNMPTMDGLTLLRAIRTDPDFMKVPIIIYTSDFTRGSEKATRAAGAQDYIVKGTMGWATLIKRIEGYLN